MSHKIHIVLFTHPTCVGCGESIRRMQRLEKEENDIDFEIMSLAGETGKKLGEKWHIHSVPTIVFDDDPENRIMGIPKPETIQSILSKLRK
jgi:predicted DsbA family dithiol-disulfide isomerase